jgi:hypothetical protein
MFLLDFCNFFAKRLPSDTHRSLETQASGYEDRSVCGRKYVQALSNTFPKSDSTSDVRCMQSRNCFHLTPEPLKRNEMEVQVLTF